MTGATAQYCDTDQQTYVDSLMNPDGFFREPQAWNESLAAVIARLDGLPELTGEHWQIIHALRAHHDRFGAVPPAFSHICWRLHLGKHCMERLFRSDREAWRIAGLPDPGEEVKAYL